MGVTFSLKPTCSTGQPTSVAPPVRWLIVNELIDYDGPVAGDSKTLHPVGSDWPAWGDTPKYIFEFGVASL